MKGTAAVLAAWAAASVPLDAPRWREGDGEIVLDVKDAGSVVFIR